MKTIKKIKNIIPSIIPEVGFKCKEFGHRYGNGTMYAKHVIAMALGNIFRVSDRELPEELESKNLLKVLSYKNAPDHSIFSKVRREIGEEIIGCVAESIMQRLYKNKWLSIIAIDSTYVPYYFKKDKDAKLGHVTLSMKEKEMLIARIRNEEKGQEKDLKKGYKLHVIYDVETSIPLYWVVLPANMHDKVVFKTLFGYVKSHFKVAHNAK
ncbi:transposase, partial [Candidatus Marsarchaeota archaeon]|nr:transposase [Candidatus Marsarchaeota archaeon]